MTKLGDKVRDKVTGFVGIVVSRTEYIGGNPRIGVQGLKLDGGVPVATVHMDEAQLSIVKRNAVPAR